MHSTPKVIRSHVNKVLSRKDTMTDPSGPVRLGVVGARGQGGFYAGLIADGKVPHMTVGALAGRR